jgi:hypothetical protein
MLYIAYESKNELIYKSDQLKYYNDIKYFPKKSPTLGWTLLFRNHLILYLLDK